MADQINSGAEGSSLVDNPIGDRVMVTAEEWGAKARSKPECYHQVAHCFGGYVPDVDQITSWHLRDLSTGAKKMIMGSSVKHLHIPMY